MSRGRGAGPEAGGRGRPHPVSVPGTGTEAGGRGPPHPRECPRDGPRPCPHPCAGAGQGQVASVPRRRLPCLPKPCLPGPFVFVGRPLGKVPPMKPRLRGTVFSASLLSVCPRFTSGTWQACSGVLLTDAVRPSVGPQLVTLSFPCFAAEFATYLNFCRSLRFDDKPDYSYLRQLFRNLFHRQGFSYDYVFDWNMLKFVSVPPATEPSPPSSDATGRASGGVADVGSARASETKKALPGQPGPRGCLWCRPAP